MERVATTAARYFLAKFIPDLRRGEPRNVGVVVWCPAGVAARFVAEKPGRTGSVYAKLIPAFVTRPPAYKQWVEYWRDALNRAEVASFARPRRVVGRESPDYLDVLAEGSRGNFVLTPAGELLDSVSDPQDAANHLFRVLVEAEDTDRTPARSLDAVCDELIRKLNLRADPHFRTQYAVKYPLPGGGGSRLVFSHAYKNGAVHRLYQRVRFTAKAAARETAVQAATWRFERVTAAQVVDKANAVSLVYVPTDTPDDSDPAQLVKVLRTASRVVNLAIPGEGEREFAGLSALAG